MDQCSAPFLPPFSHLQVQEVVQCKLGHQDTVPTHFLRSISCVYPSMVTLYRWFTPWGLEFHAHIWFLASKEGDCIYASSWIIITSRGNQGQHWIFSSQLCLNWWFDFLKCLLAEQCIYLWGKIKCVYIVIHCLIIFRLINMLFTLTTLSCSWIEYQIYFVLANFKYTLHHF
jgi:hypothetical protein